MKVLKLFFAAILSATSPSILSSQFAQLVTQLEPQKSIFGQIKTTVHEHVTLLNLRLCTLQDALPAFSNLTHAACGLRTLEKNALKKIKSSFNIADDAWDAQMLHAQETQQNALVHLQQAHPDAVHDIRIPRATLTLVTTLLDTCKINPHAVTIGILEPDTYTACKAILVCKSPSRYNGVYTPAEIMINFDLFNKTSRIEQAFMIIHEITHLLEGHSYTIPLLIELIKHHTGMPVEQIEHHPDFLAYCRVQELLASTLLATTDAHLAHIIFAGTHARFERFGARSLDDLHSTPAQDLQWANAIRVCHNKQADNQTRSC